MHTGRSFCGWRFSALVTNYLIVVSSTCTAAPMLTILFWLCMSDIWYTPMLSHLPAIPRYYRIDIIYTGIRNWHVHAKRIDLFPPVGTFSCNIFSVNIFPSAHTFCRLVIPLMMLNWGVMLNNVKFTAVEQMSIGRKWKEIIDVTDKISYSFHVSFYSMAFHLCLAP